MSIPAPGAPTGLDLGALDAVTDAVAAGAGLPEVVRAAARALDASLVLSDPAGNVLAVAARSTADEKAILAGRDGVDSLELRVAEELVGTLRLRARGEDRRARPAAGHDARSVGDRAAARARSRVGRGAREFLSALLARELTEAEAVKAAPRRSASTSTDGRIDARRTGARPRHRCRGRRRARVLGGRRARRAGGRSGRAGRAHRAPRAARRRSHRARAGRRPALAERAAESVRRELQAGLTGHSFTVGRSRPCADPGDLHRAASEALLAANVAEGDPERPVLAFDETGAYRLLLSAMSEDPAELQRFYAETVEPLVAYDEQYETDLVTTVEAFLDADGNVAGTAAAAVHAPPHDPLPAGARTRALRARRRLDRRAREAEPRAEGDAGAGIAHRGGPASEAGAAAGRVPKAR